MKKIIYLIPIVILSLVLSGCKNNVDDIDKVEIQSVLQETIKKEQVNSNIKLQNQDEISKEIELLDAEINALDEDIDFGEDNLSDTELAL